ncbi:MAG: biopolymer transporter ExbD [Leptospiraceae bacterium]|nr:biopolymer transporter ExbD [Leptospiraceae bacterium]
MRKRRNTGLDISSLLDIIFILLIFVMVSISFQKRFTSLELDLPKAKETSKGNQKFDLSISIKQKGQIFLGDSQIAKEEFFLKISKNEFRDKSILLNVEKKVLFEDFISIMNSLKDSGAKNLELGLLE